MSDKDFKYFCVLVGIVVVIAFVPVTIHYWGISQCKLLAMERGMAAKDIIEVCEPKH
jgi:hypothetical protein